MVVCIYCVVYIVIFGMYLLGILVVLVIGVGIVLICVIVFVVCFCYR